MADTLMQPVEETRTETEVNAQQTLDDLTVLANVQGQSLGEARLNVSRPVETGDGGLSFLATVHHGSPPTPGVIQTGAVQAGVEAIAGETVGTSAAIPASSALAAAGGGAEFTAEAPAFVAEPVLGATVAAVAAAEAPEAAAAPLAPAAVTIAGAAAPIGAPPAAATEGEAAPAPAEKPVMPPEPPPTVEIVEIKPEAHVDVSAVHGHENLPIDFLVAVSEAGLIPSFSGAQHGTISFDAASGEYVYTPSADYVGGDSFMVSVDDGRGHVVTETVQVDIAGPQLVAMTVPTDRENAPATGVVSAIEVGATEALAYSVPESGPGAPLHGSVLFNPDGTFVYTPDHDYLGRDSFQVTVTDQGGGFITRTVTVEVDGPEVIGTTIPPGRENDTVTGHVTAVEAGAEASLAYSVPDGLGPQHGAVQLLPDGSFTYTPDHDYTGTDSFTVLVSDGQGGTVDKVVSLTVSADAPPSLDAIATAPTTYAGHSVTGAIVAHDMEGDSLAYTVADGLGPAHGTVVVNPDGSYTYTAAPGYVGSDSFTVTVDDGHGGVATQTVPIVSQANPIAVTASGGEGHGVLTGTIAATDAAGDPMAYTLASLPEHGTLTFNPDGTYAYVPADGWTGGMTDSFTVAVSDGHGGSVMQTIALAETDAAPTAAAGDASGSHAAPIVGTFSASDGDGDALTTTATAAHGSVTVNPDGTYTYLADGSGYTGTDTVTFVTSDGHGGTFTDTAVVTVTGASAPVITADDVTVDLAHTAPVIITGTGTIEGVAGNEVIQAGNADTVIHGFGAGTTTVALGIEDALGGSADHLGTIVIGGVPAGATLSSGTLNSDGSWTVDPSHLDGLTMTAPVGADLHLTVTASETDYAGDTHTATAAMTVSFTGVGAETLLGGTGNDRIYGGAGADTLSGGGGANLLSGGAGDDVLVYNTQGTWGSGWYSENVGDPGHSGPNTLFSIQGYGTSYDVFQGGEGFDVIRMGDGNKALFLDDQYSATLLAGPRISGVEEIIAGNGNQVIDLTSTQYGYGNVTILGGTGNDVLMASGGDDVIRAGAGNDYLWGGSGNDVLYTGAGNDTLTGAEGNDTLVYTAGLGGSATLNGGTGTDTMQVQLTHDQFTSAVRAELQRYDTVLADQANAGHSFTFTTLGNLTASGMEGLQVYVDGVLVNIGSSATTVTDSLGPLSHEIDATVALGRGGSGGGSGGSSGGGTVIGVAGAATIHTNNAIVVGSDGHDDVTLHANHDVYYASNEASGHIEAQLHINAYSTDELAGATMSYSVGGLPADASLVDDGNHVLDPSHLTDAQIAAGVYLSFPDSHLPGAFDLSVTANLAEPDGSIVSTAGTPLHVEADALQHGAGDSITVSGNSDVVYGSWGDDTIAVHGNDATVYTGAGDDIVTVTGHNADIVLGGGTDTVTFTGTGGGGEVHMVGGDDTVAAGGHVVVDHLGESADAHVTVVNTDEHGSADLLFDFQSGHDVVTGGSGETWTDTLDLTHAEGALTITAIDAAGHAHTWTEAAGEHGTIDFTDKHGLDQHDLSGSATLTDSQGHAHTVDFQNIDKVTF